MVELAINKQTYPIYELAHSIYAELRSNCILASQNPYEREYHITQYVKSGPIQLSYALAAAVRP